MPQEHHHHHHHHHTKDKNKKRHVVDWLLVLVLAAGLFTMAAVFYFRYAVYSQNVMSEAVASSEYYEEQYSKFEQELGLFLSAISVPEDVINEDQGLREWYYFELRKKTLTEDRAGFFEESIHEKIEEPVRQYLTENQITLSEEAELGFENMLSSLEKNLAMEIDHPDIRSWNEERTQFFSESELILQLSALAAVCAILLLFFIQHYLYRGVHYTGIGFIIGGLLSAAYILTQYLLPSGEGAAPAGLGSISIFRQSVLFQGMLIPAAMLGAGILLLIAERLWRQYGKKS